MEELFKRLEKLLDAKFPNKEEKERLVEQAGRIILLESLDLVLQKLPGDRERQTFSSMIEKGEIDDAFSYTEKYGIKMEEIFEDRAKSVVVDLFS